MIVSYVVVFVVVFPTGKNEKTMAAGETVLYAGNGRTSHSCSLFPKYSTDFSIVHNIRSKKIVHFQLFFSVTGKNGATGATFWEINKPLALLHDGHMHMCTLVGNYWLTVYSEMSLSGSNIISKPRFYYDSDGELQLKSMVIMRLLRITFNQLMGRMYMHYL